MVQRRRRLTRVVVILLGGLLAVVHGHTVQVWTRARMSRAFDMFENFETASYPAPVIYTTLIYGDAAPLVGQRVFVTFAAITGLLTFGASMAFLLRMIVRLLPDTFEA